MNASLIQQTSRRQRGLTLTEVLVAMVIGLILIGGVIYVFISSFVSFRMNDELARLQENGRIAIRWMESDLRNAGFLGCARVDAGSLQSTLPAASPEILPEALTYGVQALPMSTSLGAQLVLSLPRKEDATLLDDVTPGDTTTVALVRNTASEQLQSGDLILIGDCGRSELFQAAAIAQTTSAVNVTGKLNFHYTPEGRPLVAPYQQVDYAYTPPGTGERDGVLKRNGEVLAEGVEIFRVCVSEQSVTRTGDSGTYTPVSGSTLPLINWDRVASLQIDLLLKAPSANGKELSEETFRLCGNQDYTTNDAILRKQFSTTVLLRNKLL